MPETHPQNCRLGYARVSTYGQTLDTQLKQLRSSGCRKIFREKVTGAHSDRRQLLKMPDTLAPRDVMTVTRIDRLARSTFDLFAIVKQIVDAKAQFRAVGRHRHQHRAADDCRAGLGRRGVRSYPHPHRRGPAPGAEARAAYGPAPAEINTGAAGRGPPATCAGRDARRTRAQLRRRQEYDFEARDG
jgi:hypothetical protein